MMLHEMGKDLFVTDGHVNFLGTEIEIRMTIIRLSDGRLLLFDPIAIDDELRQAIDALGKVAFIIAPNKFHHLFINSCGAFYPDAEIHVAPGLPKRIKDLRYHAVLGHKPNAFWADVLDQVWFSALPFSNECVFFHKPSRTLLITDLAFNIHNAGWSPAGIYVRMAGVHNKFGVSRILKMAMRNKQKARQQVDRILSWDFDRIVMAHGEIIESGGKEKLQQAFAWL